MKKFQKKHELTEIIPLLSEDSLKVASGMIEQALFMEKQLAELREIIERDGASEHYQYGSKPTAAMSTYLQIQKQYGVTVRFLADLMPKSQPENDELLDFLNQE